MCTNRPATGLIYKRLCLCMTFEAKHRGMLVHKTRSSVEGAILAVISGRLGWYRIAVSEEGVRCQVWIHTRPGGARRSPCFKAFSLIKVLTITELHLNACIWLRQGASKSSVAPQLCGGGKNVAHCFPLHLPQTHLLTITDLICDTMTRLEQQFQPCS